MTLLLACCIALGLFVMRSTGPRINLRTEEYRFEKTTYWPDCVPVAERYESVTVIDQQRATRIVEVMGTRRELLWKVTA
jgi:hypothetical protein